MGATMSADAFAEDRRVFARNGCWTGVARCADNRWLAPLGEGAEKLVRYQIGRITSHSRVPVESRTVPFRSETYAKRAGVTRQSAWAYAKEAARAGIQHTQRAASGDDSRRDPLAVAEAQHFR